MIEKKDCQLKHSKKEKCRGLWRPNVQSYIASLLCMVLLFTSLDYIPSRAATYDFADSQFQYKIIDEDTPKVEIVGKRNVTGAVTIPDEVTYNDKAYKVTSIGESAFQKAVYITSITIPDSVNSIGDCAFSRCQNLTSITLSNNLTCIGRGMFEWCNSLTNITIPDSVTSIGDYAFCDCMSLASITIPDRVTSIGNWAFSNCKSLKSITIPDRVTSIGNSAFHCCLSLTSIRIPDSVTSIGDYAFCTCWSLASITIPNRVTNIGVCAFDGCSDLTSITIPDSVTSIGDEAFRFCESLTSITISDSVTSIGDEAFSGCSSLKSFTITISEDHIGIPTIGNDCFSGCPSERYLIFLIEDGATKLDATTKPTLEDAVAAYRAVDDGNTSDKRWYGWKTEANIASVTIRVRKDGEPWSNQRKEFALKTYENQDFITDLIDTVTVGTYTIYDITGATDSSEYVDTGVTVTVNGTDANATVNYYTVSIYDVAKDEVNADTRPFQEEIILKGRSLSAPDKADEPVKDGHVFDKWVKANGSAAFGSDQKIKVTAKTDIYASWRPDAYSVTYYVNGEAYPFAEEYRTYTYGTGLILPIPDQAGYTFDGWYTDDGYTSEKTYSISKTETGDKVYYGRLTENVEPTYPITVKVNKDGTEWENHGRNFSLKTDGGDWIREPFAARAGKYSVYDMTDSTEGVNTGVIVEVKDAAAEATVNYYTVSFYDVAKEEVNEDTRPWQEEIVLERGTISAPDKADEPAKDGYTFDKWVRADGSAAFASEDTITITITEKTDIYASWIPDTYSVTYYVNGEICTVAGEYGSYTYGTGLTLPIPHQAGYTFDGWYTNAGYTSEKAYAISETETGNKVYYGRMTENVEPTYPVTIKVNKDGMEWEDHGRNFSLRTDGGDWIRQPFAVRAGKYYIYDMTDSAEGINTGVIVEVRDAAEAAVNYYTVSFYDVTKEEVTADTRPCKEEIVLEGLSISAPDKAGEPVKTGYTFDKWVRADGSAAFASGDTIPITEKTDIYASWIAEAEETFTIRASAGSGGSVFPSGEVKVISGGSQQFAMRPEEGYRISSVLVDGREMSNSGQIMDGPAARSVGAENGTKYYIFTDVISDHTLEVHFEAVHEDEQPDDNEPADNEPDDSEPDDEELFTIRASAGSGGSVLPGGEVKVVSGDSQQFAIRPEEGYRIASVLVDGVEMSDSGQIMDAPDAGSVDAESGTKYYTFTNVTSDHTLEVHFEAVHEDEQPDDIKPDDIKPDNTPDDNHAQPDVSENTGKKEPKTGDDSHINIYATIAMIASFSYLLLYFTDEERGMTEQRKKEIVDWLIQWAKKGKRPRRLIAIAAIFFLMVYYHSIGKYTAAKCRRLSD